MLARGDRNPTSKSGSPGKDGTMPAKLLTCLLAVALSGSLLSSSLASETPAQTEQTKSNWRFLPGPDTLDLFLNNHYVGVCVRSFVVHEKERTISLETHLTVGEGASTAQGLSLIERRTYGSDASLITADQKLTSKEGNAAWRLERGASGAWQLNAAVGGIENARPVPPILENLKKTIALYRGVRNRTLRSNDVFSDTSFDLMSAQTMAEETRCIEEPTASNGWSWKFINLLSALGRAETLKIDTTGATIEEGMFPFVAKRAARGQKKGSIASLRGLIGSLAVPAPRGANDYELIALTLDASQTPDSSVLPLYRHRGGAWVLSDLPAACRSTGENNEGDQFTVPTLTMQSDNIKIKRLSDSLVLKCSDRCDSIDACYRFVFSKLEKRFSPTFSNALETLDAGYGDCGEHAVLLGALLRATRIGAQVVLGLVYVPEQKNYAYHAWVMAWSHGAWVFVDPALGVFPAPRDRVPLVIDDDGTHALAVGKLLGAIRIGYVGRGR